MATRAPGPRDSRLRSILRALAATEQRLDRLSVRLTTAPPSRAVGIRRVMERTLEGLRRELRRWTDSGLAAIYGPAATGLTRNALRAVQADTFEDLARATTFVREDVKRMARDVAKRRTELMVAEGLSPAERARTLRDDLDKIGLRFIDKSGRAWKLKDYSTMVVRTKSAQAYNTGGVLRGVESGVTHFEVLDGTGDPICALANGQRWTAQRCLNNPVGHPNCRRAFAPVVPS